MNLDATLIYEQYKNGTVKESPDRMDFSINNSDDSETYSFSLGYKDRNAYPFLKTGGYIIFGDSETTHVRLISKIITNIFFNQPPDAPDYQPSDKPFNFDHPVIIDLINNPQKLLFDRYDSDKVRSLFGKDHPGFNTREQIYTKKELYAETIRVLTCWIDGAAVRKQYNPSGRCWPINNEYVDIIAVSTWEPINNAERSEIEESISRHFNIQTPTFVWDKDTISSAELARAHIETSPGKRKKLQRGIKRTTN
jgi:hypothetical protein